MKKGFTSLLIFIQFITAFQFIMPYLSYKLNYDFIVNEWCRGKYEPRFVECNGSCFLMRSQRKAAEKEQEEQEPTLSLSNPIPINIEEVVVEIDVPEVPLPEFILVSEDVITHSNRPSTPPPKV